MPVNSLLEMSRSLRLYVANLPVTLSEQFIRDRYRRILERRDWSGLRKEAEFHLKVAKTDGTVAMTVDSTTVTGTTTTFASTDVGRQFKIGSGPIYTISSVNVGAQTMVLDRTYGGTTASGLSYTLFDGYITVPSDFLRFYDVLDLENGYKLRHWVTSAELNIMDPQRNYFGQPYAVVDRLYSSAGVPQYEVWPYTTTAKTLYYTYLSRGTDLIDADDTPIWPIRSDVIVAGALADAARWPGTADSPNPYFSRPDYWKTYEQEYEDKMIEIERRDEDVYITQLITTNDGYRLAPISSSYIMSHVV